MNNFSYFNPTTIHFGKGQIASLKDELANYSRILIVYGGGSIKRNGVYQQVMDALSQ
jgi:NADP-dependent alcohol dehydrogenase